MKKIINPIKYVQRVIFSSLFSIIMLTSISTAQDIENIAGEDWIISANILFVAAKVNSEQMSISYNGLSSGSGYLFSSDNNSDGLEPSKLFETDGREFNDDAYLLKFSRKLIYLI